MATTPYVYKEAPCNSGLTQSGPWEISRRAIYNAATRLTNQLFKSSGQYQTLARKKLTIPAYMDIRKEFTVETVKTARKAVEAIAKKGSRVSMHDEFHVDEVYA
ncbi:uncharacterized protein [Littorina saxatilis]|uniref:uncharacterized protein n=1 Tax=Littorina saxatilis TaxID=31220 RepID=UPI0038B5663E